MYIARIVHARSHATTDLSWKLYCAVDSFVFVIGSIETCIYRGRESISYVISAIEARGAGIDVVCVCTILMTLYHIHHYNYAATGRYGEVLHLNYLILIHLFPKNWCGRTHFTWTLA
jgi:hypothetical protein